MKVFVIGDYRTGTGPANVTKEYIDGLKRLGCKVSKLNATSKAVRLAELFVKMPFCDVVLLSGHSNQNLWALKFAAKVKKKVAFLMHGCVEYENEINGVPDDSMTECEKKTLQYADAIYTVSHRFRKWLLARYPQYRGKTLALVNGVSKPDTRIAGDEENREKGLVFSIGGGMPRKQIKVICRAIEKINNVEDCDRGYSVRLAVAGAKGLDTDIIDSYDFVEDLGIVSKEVVNSYFRKASLFIQNSCFETFGLAPLEALSSGTSILLSKEVGALDIIGKPEETDVIVDYNDADEIACKIRFLLDNPNGRRLLDTIDFDECGWEARSKELCSKLQKLMQK